MHITVHQSIVIHQLRVDSVTSSSILQIGSAGAIRALSNMYNTGGFKEAAPQLATDSTQLQSSGAGGSQPIIMLPISSP